MPGISFDSISLSVRGQPIHSKPSSDTPFRILVLGDFSGKEGRAGNETIAGSRALMVDVDNFEERFAALHPKLSLELGDLGTLNLEFQSLEDFHPDRLFSNVPMFQKLRETRQALLNPATAQATVAELSSVSAAPPLKTPAPTQESNEDTFARLLGGAPPKQSTSATATSTGNLQELIRQIIAPHVVPGPDPNAATMVSFVDTAISEQMRRVLHHPAFKALEAAWRGLDFLIRNVDTDETLQVFFLDVSKAGLASDLRSSDDLSRTSFYQKIVEETVGSPGGTPWAVLIGNFEFGTTNEDCDFLVRLGKIAAAAHAPLIAGANGEFLAAVQSDSKISSESWQKLRSMPEATSLGLVAPRFLLRLPYGRGTETIDSFDFQEMPNGPEQDAYLWGTSALLCALLLGQSFRENEWEFTPGDVLEVAGLPVHSFKADGEQKVTPCGEFWLTDRQGDGILQTGVMPVLTVRGRDAVRIMRFQSLASPPKALTGGWGC